MYDRYILKQCHFQLTQKRSNPLEQHHLIYIEQLSVNSKRNVVTDADFIFYYVSKIHSSELTSS